MFNKKGYPKQILPHSSYRRKLGLERLLTEYPDLMAVRKVDGKPESYERKGDKGGTFILPAINSTHLYLELKKVYKEWSEDFTRYLALRINSFAANDKIPDDVLVKLVELYLEAPWHDLCISGIPYRRW